jgi:hypothetical protein
MRAFARVLTQAADDMQSHLAGARRAELGFKGPAATHIATQVTHWLERVDHEAEDLRVIAQQVAFEASGVERSQNGYDKAVARARLAEMSK